MSNHLKNQSSPYLLQHAKNPVDWYPWQEEAFDKARREDKPIFLSVGYSTCHWCHVMAHESFEDPEIAQILNENFISIKVDREERPDIDSVYMSVCQAMTGRGGWPMSVFLTAEQKPFFAGTYFPADSSHGQLGFQDILLAIAAKWKSGKADLLQSGENFYQALNQQAKTSAKQIDYDLPDQAVVIFRQTFDRQYGGFGPAPKFPTPHNLLFLTLYGQIKDKKDALSMAKQTLLAMRKGGIFDQVGYGFSRYSTDAYYLAPHFEKMLYDNALLIMAYAAMYRTTEIKLFLDVAEQTAAYVLREMTSPEGAFYSAQDADSDGVEGKFYLWDYDEICAILGKEKGSCFCAHFGVTKEGNFEGKNILHLLNSQLTDEYDAELAKLYEARKERGRLHLDDKILLSWNALMICAMSMLYRVSADEKYLAAAIRANQYIEQNLISENTLYVSMRGQTRSVKGFLDEYAYDAAALLSLYEATHDDAYLARAQAICRQAQAQFADLENGGYFLYGVKNSALIAKPKECFDGALPSGNSVMAYCLVRLSQYTGEQGEPVYADKQEFEALAKRQLAFLSAQAKEYAAGHSLFLLALLLWQNPLKITVVCAEQDEKEEIARRLPLYAQIEIVLEGEGGYKLLNGKTTYYVCENHTCYPPSNECIF